MGMQCEQPTERLLFKDKPLPLIVIKAVKVHANEASPQVCAMQVLFHQTSFVERPEVAHGSSPFGDHS